MLVRAVGGVSHAGFRMLPPSPFTEQRRKIFPGCSPDVSAAPFHLQHHVDGPSYTGATSPLVVPELHQAGNVDLTNKDRSESGICESYLTCTVPTGNQKASAALGFRVTFFKMPVIGRAGRPP